MRSNEPNTKDARPVALDDWADHIAALEPDVVAAVASRAKRLAGDRRLSEADRQFAIAQADAVRRAVKRAKAAAKKNKTST